MGENHVLDTLLQIVGAMGDDRNRRGAEQKVENADIVRRKIPKRVHVARTDPSSGAGHRDNKSGEFTRVDELLQEQDRGIVEEGVAHHQRETAGASEARECVHLADRHRQRFFDEDMGTGLQV